MVRCFTFAALLAVISSSVSAQSNLTFHDYSEVTIQGDTLDMSQFYGKKVMVVNTASFCGYTPQFEELQALYNQYNQYNFEIIGFPCNDFGSQDPGSDSAILDFCTANYGVAFQMMHKVDIVSGDTAPVYKWLQRADLNGVQNAHVGWNFNKFLIDEAGNWIKHYGSTKNPLDTAITNWILSPSVVTSAHDVNGDDVTLKTVSNFSDRSIDFIISTNAPREIQLDLFTVDGRYVQTVFNGTTKNQNMIRFDGSALPAGMYFVRLESNSIRQTSKCMIVR